MTTLKRILEANVVYVNDGWVIEYLIEDVKEWLQQKQLLLQFDKFFDSLVISMRKVDEGNSFREKLIELLEELK